MKYKDSAKLLRDANDYESSVSRLYYSIYFLIEALFIKNELHAKSHKGKQTVLFKEFVNTQKIDRKYAKFFSELYQLRQISDYAYRTDITLNDVDHLIIEGEKFRNILLNLIGDQK